MQRTRNPPNIFIYPYATSVSVSGSIFKTPDSDSCMVGAATRNPPIYPSMVGFTHPTRLVALIKIPLNPPLKKGEVDCTPCPFFRWKSKMAPSFCKGGLGWIFLIFKSSETVRNPPQILTGNTFRTRSKKRQGHVLTLPVWLFAYANLLLPLFNLEIVYLRSVCSLTGSNPAHQNRTDTCRLPDPQPAAPYRRTSYPSDQRSP